MTESSLEQQRTIEDLKQQLVSETAQLGQQLKECQAENTHLKYEVEQGKVKIATLEKELACVKGELDQLRDHINSSNPHLDLEVHDHPDPPVDIRGGSSAALGDKTYFRLVRTKTVYKYNSQSKTWKEMPTHPHKAFTLVCVNRTLTTVGGGDTKLYSLVNERWEHYAVPPLPTKRYVPVAIYCENKLVVAGGIEENTELESSRSITNIVELLDTRTVQWSTVSPLPYGVHQTTAVQCGGSLYIAAGHGAGLGSDILKCSWSQLLTSKKSEQVWNINKSFSVSFTTLEVLQGHLLAIGGQVDGQPTADVYWYKEVLNQWEKIGAMSLARDECRSAVLPNDTLLVVGSHTSCSPSNRRKVDILRLKSLRSQSFSTSMK